MQSTNKCIEGRVALNEYADALDKKDIKSNGFSNTISKFSFIS